MSKPVVVQQELERLGTRWPQPSQACVKAGKISGEAMGFVHMGKLKELGLSSAEDGNKVTGGTDTPERSKDKQVRS